jgi:hypothetical protein
LTGGKKRKRNKKGKEATKLTHLTRVMLRSHLRSHEAPWLFLFEKSFEKE